MDEARALCAIDISGRPYLLLAAELPAGRDRRLRARAARGVLPRASPTTRSCTIHIEIQAPGNAHHMIEAAFKAFARALRARGRDRPDRDGRPEHQGGAVVLAVAAAAAHRDRPRRLRDGQPPVGREGARARRRARRSSARTRTCSASCSGARACPGVGAFPKAMERLRALGARQLPRRARRRGGAAAGDLPRDAPRLRPLERARRRRGARDRPRQRCASSTPTASSCRRSAGTRCAGSARRAGARGRRASDRAYYHVHSFVAVPDDAARRPRHRRVRRALRLGRLARLVPRRPVPPREVLARRAARCSRTSSRLRAAA